MSDTSGEKPITQRQAAARRENGKMSRGPVTEEGKRRSSKNSFKHGVYGLTFAAIERGALREEPEEIDAFVNAVVSELDPGDSLVLRQLAANVAVEMLRDNRALRWEALGYSRASSYPEVTRADVMTHRAWKSRYAAETVHRMPDSSLTSRELWDALAVLGGDVADDETWLDVREDASAEVMHQAVEQLIRRHFSDREDAVEVLKASALRLEDEANAIRRAFQPEVAYSEVNGSFTENVMRLRSHTSRELDKATDRYWDAWRRLRAGEASERETNLPLEESDTGPG